MKRFRAIACLVAITAPLMPASAHAAPQPEVLAYASNGGISVSSPPGAPGVQVVRQGQHPAVSPDGSRLAWSALSSDHHAHIFVAPVSGGAAVQLTSGPATDQSPAWSPDGTRLALTRFGSDGIEHLALVSADGSDGQLLDVRGSAPSWSPDGRLLAFRGSHGVSTVDPAGRGETVLSTILGLPSWSTDGTKVAVPYGSVRVIDVASRQSTVVLTEHSDTLPSTFYEDATFNAAGDRLYARHVEVRSKEESTDDIRRYTLDGQLDSTFTPVAENLGYGFSGSRLISVGGGTRPTPVRTAPTSVSQLDASPAPSRVRLTWTPAPATSQLAGYTVRYTGGSTPPATVAEGSAVGDTLGSSLVIGRLAPSTAYSFSVFTRDWSGASSTPVTATVTTPSTVATTLTLSGPGTITYGQSSVLSGQLIREDTGAPVAGARLTLLGHHTGQRDGALGTVTTDGNGRFSTKRLTSEATRYSVRYAGTVPLGPSAANTLVLVRQRIVITFSPSSRVRAYSTATVTATVAPAFPGGNVRMDQYSFSGGSVLTKLNSRSQVTVPLNTSRRDATARAQVTPGARTGYLSEPASADYDIY